MGARLINYLSNQNATICVLERTQNGPHVISAEQTKRVCVCVKCSSTGENSCPLKTFPTKPLQLDGLMGGMDPVGQQWADGGSPSKIFTHFFLFNLNWIFYCWIEY